MSDLCDSCEAEKTTMAQPLPRRRIPRPDFYDIRQLVMLLAWLSGVAGLVMGDIWLSGHL